MDYPLAAGLLDSAPLGVALWHAPNDDPADLVLYSVNPKASAIMELDLTPFVGMRISEAFPAAMAGEVGQRLCDVVWRSAMQGEETELEFEYAEAQITRRWLRNSYRPLTPGYRAVYYKDISNEVAYRVSSAESLGRATALAGLSAGLVDSSPRMLEQVFAAAAEQIVEYVGATAAILTFSDPTQCLAIAGPVADRLDVPRMLETPDVAAELSVVLAAGRSAHWLRTAAQPSRWGRALTTTTSGEIYGAYLIPLVVETVTRGAILCVPGDERSDLSQEDAGFVREVATRVAAALSIAGLKADLELANEHLLASNTDLDRKNRDLAAFAAMAAHDLKSPLVKISAFLAMLQRQYPVGAQVDATAMEFMDYARAGAVGLQTLLDDLLAFGEAGEAQTRAELNLATIISETWHGLGAAGALDCQVDQAAPVWGNESLLRQVFANPFSNAIKFARPGVPPQVTVSLRSDAGVVAICVSDNGIGIPAEFAASVFEPFKRLNADAYAGSGIGLAICRRAVEWHGGAIGLIESAQSGTTVQFTLADARNLSAVPSQADVPTQANRSGDQDSRREQTGTETPTTPPPDAEPRAGSQPIPQELLRVLVVDDELADRLLMQRALTQRGGFAVEAAADGDLALERLHQEAAEPDSLPDVILLDLRMPRVDCHEFLRRMKA